MMRRRPLPLLPNDFEMQRSTNLSFVAGRGETPATFFFNDHTAAAAYWNSSKSTGRIDLLTIRTDRPEALYHKGEIVNFNLRVHDLQHPMANGLIDWVLSKDGVIPPIAHGTVALKDGKASITGTLEEPGFLRCDVTYQNGKETVTAPAAAAIDPTEIKPSLPVPDDFDAFWAQKKKELAAVPVNARLTPVPPPSDWSWVETFDLQADCVGAPVSGYYARPISAKPKSYPAMLMVDGAGVRSTDLISPTRFAQQGFLTLAINAHGIPNGQPDEFYDALNKGELKDYRTRGRESRDTYYFLGMYLRVLRALDFLASQPEWDGHTLFLQGGSQGGAQALAGAALDSRVSFVLAIFPAACDHTGMLAGRIAGWPKLITVGADGQQDPAILETSRYFDGVNFSSRIKAPAFVWMGFLDKVTPPTCAYAAYNSIPGRKEIINDPYHGHDTPDDVQFWSMVAEILLTRRNEQTGFLIPEGIGCWNKRS